ncbi:unannotated protein [freshwater metagenome]|uniref:Unannotated protein n=1 Tax=freshwater metagenome TaxID=449393 RepID=A0A6J7CM82_9ZZZZ|nr:EamA family transporter [Actinomycetota bacterium]
MSWFIPTTYFIVATGALGITSKFALRSLQWQDLILYSGLGYVFVAGVLLASGHATLRLSGDGWWAAASAALAISGLIALYVALNSGKAGIVVPVSAAYPAFTLLLAAAFLDERITFAKGAGVLLVIGGVVLLTVAD